MIKPESILIVRTDRIGDVVLSLPLAELIKRHYPQCRVTFLLREYTRSLAEGNPFIDEVLVLKEKDGKPDIIGNVDMLRDYDFDTAIVVYPTFRTSLIIYMSSIKYRIGSGFRWYSLIFNKRIYEHRKYAERHELEFNVRMLSFLGIKDEVNPSNIKFNIPVDQFLREEIRKELLNGGAELDRPLVLVHPGSGGSAVDLPLPKLKELITSITDKYNLKIVLTGTASETELCRELSIPGKTIDLSGRYNLKELTALIDISSIFIANSTGPLHIAAALGKYVIAFYPKIQACSVNRWGPYTDRKAVFTPEMDCHNCTREQCLKLDCMSTIDVKNIFHEFEKIYKFILNNGDFND